MKQDQKAKRPGRMVRCRIKREYWICHAIPSAERDLMLRKISELLACVRTDALIDILPEIGKYTDDDVITESIVEEHWLSPDVDPERDWPGLDIIEDSTTEKQPGTNDQDHAGLRGQSRPVSHGRG